MSICPFCGHDPYEYVDVGLGGRGVPVAITCCKWGPEVFGDRKGDTVTMNREQFDEIAETLTELRKGKRRVA